MYTSILFAFLALVTYLFVSNYLTKRRHAAKARELGCSEPPTYPKPWYDPQDILGVREVFRRAAQGLLLTVFEERDEKMDRLMGRRCSTYKHEALGASVIVTSDPENLKAVLATQFQDFLLGKRIPVMEPLLGTGIFASDGKTWEHSRSMLRPSFVRERITDLELEDRHNRNLHQALPVNADGWTDILDMQPLFFRLTIDSSTEFLFGQSVDSQLAMLPGAKPNPNMTSEKDFALNFDKAQEYLGWRFRLNSLYWLLNSSSFQKTVKHCHDFIDHYVDLALHPPAEKSAVAAASGKPKQYIFLNELVEQSRDPLFLRYELLNILLAGRDTTASMLSWLFFELSRNPHIYAKLRAAILDSFGTLQNPSEITFRKLKECSYLQYCLNEALRLYPVVPLNGRTAARDTSIPRGGGKDGKDPVFVPKGHGVAYSVYVMHRDKTLWGQDADVFRPERWEGRRYGWEYLPFNGGPRICLGQQFALTSGAYCTLRLAQRFESLESHQPDPVVRFDQSLTSKLKGGLWIRLREEGKGVELN